MNIFIYSFEVSVQKEDKAYYLCFYSYWVICLLDRNKLTEILFLKHLFCSIIFLQSSLLENSFLQRTDVPLGRLKKRIYICKYIYVCIYIHFPSDKTLLFQNIQKRKLENMKITLQMIIVDIIIHITNHFSKDHTSYLRV